MMGYCPGKWCSGIGNTGFLYHCDNNNLTLSCVDDLDHKCIEIFSPQKMINLDERYIDG
jgi:hypothetical protein